MYHGIMRLWEKVGYIGSLEWCMLTVVYAIVPARKAGRQEEMRKSWWQKGKLDVNNAFYNAEWLDIVEKEELDHANKVDSKLAFAVIFLLQMYGGLPDVPGALTAVKLFLIFITAVVASVRAAAIPSAGLVTMAIVASSVGLPLHYIVIIYAVDHVLDMFRTSTNVMGDVVGAVIVNRFELKRLGDPAM
jgi:hypothetical protein